MIVIDEDRRFVRQFSSLLEMVDFIRSTPSQWLSTSSVRDPAKESWDDNVGFEGALRLAADGWPDGVREIFASAALVPTSYATTRGYDVAGEYPDVARALGGDPRCMVRRGKTYRPRPVITIAMNVAVRWDVPAVVKANYGAALTGLVDRLEQRGVRVELYAANAANGPVTGQKISVAWCVKRAEDAVDLSAIAFSVAHPAMSRRLCFAAHERSPRRHELFGYGRPQMKLDASYFIDLPEETLYLGGPQAAIDECRTLEGATKFLELQINAKFGERIAELEAA